MHFNYNCFLAILFLDWPKSISLLFPPLTTSVLLSFLSLLTFGESIFLWFCSLLKFVILGGIFPHKKWLHFMSYKKKFVHQIKHISWLIWSHFLSIHSSLHSLFSQSFSLPSLFFSSHSFMHSSFSLVRFSSPLSQIEYNVKSYLPLSVPWLSFPPLQSNVNPIHTWSYSFANIVFHHSLIQFNTIILS